MAKVDFGVPCEDGEWVCLGVPTVTVATQAVIDTCHEMGSAIPTVSVAMVPQDTTCVQTSLPDGRVVTGTKQWMQRLQDCTAAIQTFPWSEKLEVLNSSAQNSPMLVAALVGAVGLSTAVLIALRQNRTVRIEPAVDTTDPACNRHFAIDTPITVQPFKSIPPEVVSSQESVAELHEPQVLRHVSRRAPSGEIEVGVPTSMMNLLFNMRQQEPRKNKVEYAMCSVLLVSALFVPPLRQRAARRAVQTVQLSSPTFQFRKSKQMPLVAQTSSEFRAYGCHQVVSMNIVPR